ncbi:hypothetical protein ILYODFUR_030947 [Ilyodon furcidens]|uniref:NADH dehydrogenase [ubiquinone] 1 alpha subcomplex subunit 12 n=1 Tax=Ilyodon furcidens TaxID=33524 RepID=A0ABV0U9W7_9TELE
MERKHFGRWIAAWCQLNGMISYLRFIHANNCGNKRNLCVKFLKRQIKSLIVFSGFKLNADSFKYGSMTANVTKNVLFSSSSFRHRWLHCMTDDPPTTHPPEPKKFLAEVHQFNVSGTSQQYVPYPTTRKKIHEWVPPKAGAQ